MMNLRDSIVQSVFDLFISKGIDNVSVNDIIKELNMTKGGFYYYFKSKDELISEIIDKHVIKIIWRQLRLAEEQVSAEGLPVKEKMRMFYTIVPRPCIVDEQDNIIQCYSIKKFYFLLYDLIDKFPRLSDEYKKYYIENRNIFINIINEGKKQNVVRHDIDSENFAELLMATRDGMFSLYMINGEECIGEKIKMSFDVIWQQLSNEEI
ncbi:TetR/AcrR family transcriptional regulator [Anaerotignum sp. MSJ-24]|uniref:TetR/AcrR family transcriptional regulator n=1 Tax=Anaerotignum sp. MSJ-24 TaxID=2841521 RepID=UPI001C0F5DC7|nr:TetR/AcrR family transcriptional regulator [Anaerotignum sp. MSJ-24]MBU5464283.1 TetR/AcrR family transcriptional regulator [Anaerotignum sp. MSJ-24]